MINMHYNRSDRTYNGTYKGIDVSIYQVPNQGCIRYEYTLFRLEPLLSIDGAQFSNGNDHAKTVNEALEMAMQTINELEE